MKNYTLTQKIVKFTIIFMLVITCMNMNVFATDPVDPSTDPEEKIPYIEFKVKTVKVNDTKQVLVECWGKDFTNLVGMDFVITYDNTKLTPSYISGEKQNQILEGLNTIQYVNKPDVSNQPGLEGNPEEEFYQESTRILKNCFSFNNELTKTITNGSGEDETVDLLGMDVFKYLASTYDNEDNEVEKALQIALTLKDFNENISGNENGILLGTLSFKLEDDANVSEEENSFSTVKMGVMCDDGKVANAFSNYERDTAVEGDDISELTGFTYEKKGSISGTITTGYYTAAGDYKENGSKRTPATKTATIYLFDSNDVANLDLVTARKYKTNRAKLISFYGGVWSKCCIPDETAETEANNQIKYVMKYKLEKDDAGVFKLEDVEFGNYMVFIDKYNFGDYIVTNVTIDSNTKDIDLGKIELIAGDMNKDGTFTTAGDRTPFQTMIDMQSDGTDLPDGINLIYDLNDDGKALLSGDRNVFTIMQSHEKMTLKVIRNFSEEA